LEVAPSKRQVNIDLNNKGIAFCGIWILPLF